jgi:nitroreductase
MTDAQTTKDQIAFLRGLNATRMFRPDPVPDDAVTDILQVARWSGSASNVQPWEFLVIRDRETMKKLAEVSPNVRHVGAAPLAIVLVMTGDPEKVSHETYDEGRLAERIMLAAQAHGLGSCIGWFRPETMSAAKQLLGIPENRLVRTEISIGYPDEAAQSARQKPAQARKPLSEIVHEEKYRA